MIHKRLWWLGGVALVAVLLAGGGGAWHYWNDVRLAHAAGQDNSTTDMPGMAMPSSPANSSAITPVPEGYTALTVTPAIQQRIGVMVGKVTEGPLEMQIQTVGIVRPNESKVAHIHLKTEGWVEKLFVSFTGQKVHAGDPLLSIYSPQFYTAQREYLSALGAAKIAAGSGFGDQKVVVEASRRRLELWDVPADEITELEKTGNPIKSLVLRSKVSGTVLEKKAFEGQYVSAQDELYMVADLSTVWVQAKIFESEVPHVELGQAAAVSLPSLPGQTLTGKIVFIDPTVEEAARTVQVRIELPNTEGKLKPGMFARVTIEHPMGQGLLIPSDAVIRTGERNIVYRVESEGRFVPVEITISPIHFGSSFQVLTGLKAEDRVVTSANFLIDSESRLQAGGGSMTGMAGMDMGGSGGSKTTTPPHLGPASNDSMKGMEMPGKEVVPPGPATSQPPATAPAMTRPSDSMPGMDMNGMDMPATAPATMR